MFKLVMLFLIDYSISLVEDKVKARYRKASHDVEVKKDERSD